jgi:hypothetical protein
MVEVKGPSSNNEIFASTSRKSFEQNLKMFKKKMKGKEKFKP